MKTGRLSREEWHFIEENAEKLSVEEIAAKLERAPEPIIKYLKRIGKTENKMQAIPVQAEYDIKSRPYWKELKNQFTSEELELFLYHWKQIVAQFRKDVLPTEELQIVDMIKLEILMNRALREQQDSMSRVRELETDLYRLRAGNSDQDREEIFNIERQVASLRAAKESISKEYKDLQTKKAALYKDMKATREQRIQRLESDKESFAGLIQRILRDPEFNEEQGKMMERMRMAMEKEKARLSDYHTYGDGGIDRPFLTPESVLEE